MSDRLVAVTTPQCMHCGNYGLMEVRESIADAIDRGELIQDAAPDLAPPLREQLKSGIHPECWAAMFH